MTKRRCCRAPLKADSDFSFRYFVHVLEYLASNSQSSYSPSSSSSSSPPWILTAITCPSSSSMDTLGGPPTPSCPTIYIISISFPRPLPNQKMRKLTTHPTNTKPRMLPRSIKKYSMSTSRDTNQSHSLLPLASRTHLSLNIPWI